MKKTVNCHFLFRLQQNCPVFQSNIQDRQRSGQRFFDHQRRFVQSLELSHGRLPIIFDWRANVLIQSERSVRRHTDYSKRPPVRAAGFSLLPLQSPRGFSALARLYYLARRTKAAMLRRLPRNKFNRLQVPNSITSIFPFFGLNISLLSRNQLEGLSRFRDKGAKEAPQFFSRPFGPRFHLKIRGWPATSSSGRFSLALEVGPPPKPLDFLQRVCSNESHKARLICFSDF